MMKYRIEYERNNTARTRIKTTYISRETETDLVIGRFEKMHGGRLTVIECRPFVETPKQLEARLSAFERDLLPVRKAKSGWQLNRVDDIDWTQDNSGVYVYINWDLQTESVRLDIMTKKAVPLVSFAGKAENVRKATMHWLFDYTVDNHDCGFISLEHASYIGAELERADTERTDYVQD